MSVFKSNDIAGTTSVDCVIKSSVINFNLTSFGSSTITGALGQYVNNIELIDVTGTIYSYNRYNAEDFSTGLVLGS